MPALRTPRKYKGKSTGIPFSAVEKGSTRYKLKLKIDQAVANFDQPAAIEEAVDRYIIHYFPEFYIALYDQPAFMAANEDPNDAQAAFVVLWMYETLRVQLGNKIEIDAQYPTSPPSDNEIMIFSLRYDVFKAREQLTNQMFQGETDQKQMPSFEASLNYFNSENGFGPTESQTEFPIKKMPAISQSLQGAFTKFSKQQKRSRGPKAPISVDFNSVGTSVGKIMATLVGELMETVKGAGRTYKFREGDTLTLYFGASTSSPSTEKAVVVPDSVITDIKYLATDKSIAAEQLKVGHFSLVKYSPLIKDKVVLGALKNYSLVLKMDKEASKRGPNSFSVDEFFGEALGVDTADGFPLEWDTSNDSDVEQDDENNALINTAVDLGIIDIADTAGLQVSIAAYTTEQLTTLNAAVTQNPELYTEVFAGQEKKKDEASPDFLNQIEKVLADGPMGAVADNSPVGAFFRHFGIDTLVKEALLCLTFGINFEIDRITALIGEIKGLAFSGNIVVEFGGSVKGVTKPQISLPSLGDLSLSFPMFTITGDIWKMILEIIIESLEKALIQVIAQLVELLRELCDFNNPRSRDYGDTNMRDLMPLTAPGTKRGARGQEDDSNPDMGAQHDPFDPFRGSNVEEASGMTPDEILDYLEDLSSILSSMEICVLLTNPASAEEDLLQKILDYNLAYGANAQVAQQMTTFTEIIGFFAELAKVVDVTDLCNEIANEVAVLNQDNLCLTEDDIQSVNMDDVDNIETLLDILKNGLRPGVAGVPEVFRPNFECPDKPNYVEDPTFRKSIYETLNVLIETVELQFSYSTESIKNVLLDSRLTAAGGAAFDAIGAAEVPPLSEEWAPAPNKAMIDILKAMIQGFENVEQYSDDIEDCINDNQDVFGLDVNLDFDDITRILNVVKEGMELGFATGGQLGGLVDTLGDLSNASEQGTPLISRKVFNKRFLREFEDYILISQPSTGSTGAPTWNQNILNSMNPASFMNNTNRLFNVPSQGTTGAGGAYNFRGSDPASMTNLLGYGREILTWYFRPLMTKSGGTQFTTAAAETAAQAAALKKFASWGTGTIKLWYPPYQDTTLDGLSSFALHAIGVSTTSEAGADFAGDILPDTEIANLTMDPFIESVKSTLRTDRYPPGNSIFYQPAAEKYAQRRAFPMANALLTDYLFDYYIKNGVFDAATLQSLSFFHNNENCQPGDTSDLLDVGDILNKMLRMFEKLACGSDLPARKKVRLALKYGMYLLFVQIHIAEFIIKNIFVFAATEIDELFAKPFITMYMRAQIENSMANYLADIDESVRDMFVNDLTELFQQVNQVEGGITDYEGNVVFNSGEKLPPDEATYNKIINYLIGERIMDSKSAVNNAIKQAHPNANPKPLDEIFLHSIPAYQTAAEWANGGPFHLDPHFQDEFGQDDGFFLPRPAGNTRRVTIQRDFGLDHDRPRLFILKSYYPRVDLLRQSRTLGPDSFVSATLIPRGIFSVDEMVELGPPTALPFDNNLRLMLLQMDTDIENGLGIEYIIRYKFFLSFPDPDMSAPAERALVTEHRLYPLLPAGDSGTSGAELGSRPVWVESDHTFDRTVWLPSSGPGGRREFEQARPGQGEDFKPITLTQDDVDFLMGIPEYQDYFTNVFDKGVLSMIPIIQNFYLTTKYFDEITGAMKPPKDACLNIVKNTIASDDKYDKTPDMSRDNVASFTNTFSGDDAFESFMRDFILIMLIKTPIDILKGILELIDPHVAISKMIKTITGQVFNILSRVFDEILDSAPEELTTVIDSGEKLLAIVLCLVDVVMKNPPGTPPGPAQDMLLKQNMEAFFPRITAEGIDFLGSIMGMFMIPPSPLGILYLLLSLINVEVPEFGVDTGDNAVVNSSDPSAPTAPDC